MRTTLSIDDDVLDAVRARARHQGRTAGAVLSDLARAALTQGGDRAEGARRHGFPILSGPGHPVTNDRIEDLRDRERV